MTWPAPVTLAGDHVRLEPLNIAHAEALKASAADLGQLWYTSIPTVKGMEAEITRRIGLHDMQPFTVMTPDRTPVGMTTFMNTDEVNRRVEIGSTWIGRAVQRTPLNTEAKFLMLRHAFEDLSCNAVEFRTHRMNFQSRRAIERLGAQLDGILRAHMVMSNGTLRDTAVYSIVAAEWPIVHAHLLHKLEQ
ncbi:MULTISPECIES: GNAT family N-acetyltransferase [unclassified Ruegeria]|uniref:GNAT family N-acetyltransferase n=1 Tax=unclassified Ruegeria TaxID=2625375 RepID=UPI001491F248|nr:MULTISPECIES: GNAT family protein [unclassified Ruegeria]NOD48391.1 GNAT family N-acetyltransferase [Ruegeria sp. HKCCD5849]NOD52411.1 GNAT family N-acetyltransferase [Ruegeria sp. HKCCD5851]NOD68514.1 GNAT family N-acetyltransferase [Ruegeria sp. HKCCD7303]